MPTSTSDQKEQILSQTGDLQSLSRLFFFAPRMGAMETLTGSSVVEALAHCTGRYITTSDDLTPNGGLCGESPPTTLFKAGEIYYNSPRLHCSCPSWTSQTALKCVMSSGAAGLRTRYLVKTTTDLEAKMLIKMLPKYLHLGNLDSLGIFSLAQRQRSNLFGPCFSHGPKRLAVYFWVFWAIKLPLPPKAAIPDFVGFLVFGQGACWGRGVACLSGLQMQV